MTALVAAAIAPESFFSVKVAIAMPVETPAYDQKAVLLATFSDELATSTELLDYFVGLAQKDGLNVEFNEQNIRVLDENTASNSGLYTFSYVVEEGKTVYVPARYTFLYEKVGDQWLILEHHSSIRPEKAES